MLSFLLAQDGLAVFEQGCVDIENIVDLMRNKVGDDQIEGIAGRESDPGAGEEIRVTADALQIDPVLAATFLAVPAALILMLTVLILIIRRR